MRMDEDDEAEERAAQWLAARRRRNFLAGAVMSSVLSVLSLLVLLLGARWAIGFFASFGTFAVVLFLVLRGERLAHHDQTSSRADADR